MTINKGAENYILTCQFHFNTSTPWTGLTFLIILTKQFILSQVRYPCDPIPWESHHSGSSSASGQLRCFYWHCHPSSHSAHQHCRRTWLSSRFDVPIWCLNEQQWTLHLDGIAWKLHLDCQFAEARLVKYCGRRILCQPSFSLFLASRDARPNFSSYIASVTTLINYGCSNESVVDDLLHRAFVHLRPELYKVIVLHCLPYLHIKRSYKQIKQRKVRTGSAENLYKLLVFDNWRNVDSFRVHTFTVTHNPLYLHRTQIVAYVIIAGTPIGAKQYPHPQDIPDVCHEHN